MICAAHGEAVPEGCRGIPNPSHHGMDSGSRICVSRDHDELSIILGGKADAEMIVGELPKFLATPKCRSKLRLNLEAVEELDDLAVSALIVMLRCYGRAFRTVSMTGLAARIVWRLQSRECRDLLGLGWQVSYVSGQVKYWRV